MKARERKNILWRDRVDALVEAMHDVTDRPGPWSRGATGGTAHREVFGRYVTALNDASVSSDDWWRGLIESEQSRTRTTLAEATAIIEERWPVGRAANPEVTTVLRNTWIECEVINAEVPESERVPPEEFTLLWLCQDARTEPLAMLLADLPFLPLGLSADGGWI